ncbi:MAG: hypothetical protein L6Q37_06780 [Bdellovibrionaceae bacterium]|nr:hypothetical protein [Bacteriovoracaceae bacterium]MCK6598052.1 hypothetical protein [Pseudobdellovibrionaceae bacterium]NUM58995.1 hypothetical protein [Pseudobdellovibrionaceae bacterium]
MKLNYIISYYIFFISLSAHSEVVNVFNKDGSVRAAILKKSGSEDKFLIRVDGTTDKKIESLVLEYEKEDASAGAYYLKRGGENWLRKNGAAFGESIYELYASNDTIKLSLWNPKNKQKPLQPILSDSDMQQSKESK